ncbi:glucosaminidase domain-containing protein [Chitinophaga sp. XS-30]|uniref:glucosaminidase domain-containing protein n=1 Tax=Chitinophaga sp. XS-30 TaxID=2604421 RepID=UPI0011DE038A|nr:glucosaminidase domain-containing protein [Chitinophaga sp. XS-30]QEH39487.1 muramidase [Chitinophaga sp. XS-30]
MLSVKKQLLLSGILVTTMAASSQQTQTLKKYRQKFEPVAVNLMKETGVPASIILGVAMLESGLGTSKNARLLRNHFGIVGKNNLAKRGETYRSVYREFESDTASYRYFARLVTRKRWFTAMKGNDDYGEWLKKLIQSNYSTAGQVWIDRVTAVIKHNKLYELDGDLKLAKQ